MEGGGRSRRSGVESSFSDFNRNPHYGRPTEIGPPHPEFGANGGIPVRANAGDAR